MSDKNRNPELDHEFREGEQKQGKPIIYRDFDGSAEPYEMLEINRAGGLKTNGWKDILIKIAVVIGAFIVGGLLIYGFNELFAAITGDPLFKLVP